MIPIGTGWIVPILKLVKCILGRFHKNRHMMISSIIQTPSPNTTATVETFQKAAEWAATEGNLTQEILEEAWLKAFKAIDAPLAPQSRGASLFTNLMDDESRQIFRDGLLDTTPEQMRACAEKYLVGKTPALAIVGNPTAVPDVKSAGWACVDAEGNPLKEE